MAVNKDSAGFINLTAEEIDPAVAATIGRGQKRQAEANLTPKQRKKKRKQKEKNQQAKPRRMDVLVDPAVKEQAGQIADRLKCSQSNVVEFALRYLFAAVQAGEVDLTQYTEPVQNPAYQQLLKFPAD